MKKASINQTIKIAKKLGGETVSWSDKLSQDEAEALLKRIQSKKNSLHILWIIIFSLLLISTAITSYIIYKFKEPQNVYVIKHNYTPTQTQQKKPIVSINTQRQKTETPKDNIIRITPKTSEIKITPYTEKQIKYASLKTVELVNKLKENASVFIEKTSHKNNKEPLLVFGIVIIDGKKLPLKSTFSHQDKKTKIEIKVEDKIIYSN